MPEVLYTLTDEDVKFLRELKRREESRPLNIRPPNKERTTSQAPEVYIAKIPGGGIPARVTTTPGFATCDIYYIDRDTNTLTLSDAEQQTVYNLSTSAISASLVYTKVTRDKAGSWIADAPGGSSNDVVFQLTSTLSPTSPYSEASAKICSLTSFGGSNIYDATGGADIVVVDPFAATGPMWNGVAGYRGLGRLRSDGRYDVIFLEMTDGMFEFTVYTDRNPASSSMTVTITGTYQQGGRGDSFGTGAVTLYDTQYLFKRALAGGKGVGLWDYFTQTHRVIQCQQQCITAKALVNQTGGTNTTGAVAIDNFIATSPSPFNLVPATLPTTAYNTFHHYAADNDQVWLQWNESNETWVITDVLHKPHNTLTDIRQNSANTYFEAEQVQASLEYIDDPSYSNKIAIGACP